jgi:hypothetical protein
MQDNIVLAGSLKFLALGDILQLLGANSSTGKLRLISRYASEPGFIYIENGNPVNASCGSKIGPMVNSSFQERIFQPKES